MAATIPAFDALLYGGIEAAKTRGFSESRILDWCDVFFGNDQSITTPNVVVDLGMINVKSDGIRIIYDPMQL